MLLLSLMCMKCMRGGVLCVVVRGQLCGVDFLLARFT